MKRNKKDILIFFIILIANASFMLTRDLLNLDELWNYNFARNICDGLLPYKDFNLIITPLYPTIVAIFLKFIANELIVSRIIGIVLFTGISFLTYKILEHLLKNKWIPIILIMGLLFVYREEFWGDYNFAVLFITLLVIFLELRNNKGNVLFLNKTYDFWTGFLIGLAILTKQTTGCVLAFTFIFYKILFVKEKNDIILAMKISLTRLVGIIIPVMTFLVYLLITNSFMDFLDYTVLGISTFSNSFPYRELLLHPDIDIMYKVIGVLIPVCFIFNIIAMLKTKNLELTIILIFSLQNMIVVYPLFDITHSLIAVLPLFITFFYSIYLYFANSKIYKNLQSKKLNIAKKLFGILIVLIAILSILAIVAYSIFNFINYTKKCNNDLKHLNGIPMKADLHDYISNLSLYVVEQENKGKKIYIITTDAVLTMIVLDKYNKNYDMLTKGNLGARGEEGIIEEISNMDNNSLFMINGVKSLNRQSTELVRSYIQNNLKKIRNSVWYGSIF